MLIAYLESRFQVAQIETLTSAIVFVGIILLAGVADRRLPWLCPKPRSVWNFGNYTYALYLTHIPLMMLASILVFCFHGADTSIFRSPPVISIILVLCAFSSFIVYHFFEVPLKAALAPRQRTAPIA